MLKAFKSDAEVLDIAPQWAFWVCQEVIGSSTNTMLRDTARAICSWSACAPTRKQFFERARAGVTCWSVAVENIGPERHRAVIDIHRAFETVQALIASTSAADAPFRSWRHRFQYTRDEIKP